MGSQGGATEDHHQDPEAVLSIPTTDVTNAEIEAITPVIVKDIGEVEDAGTHRLLNIIVEQGEVKKQNTFKVTLNPNFFFSKFFLIFKLFYF